MITVNSVIRWDFADSRMTPNTETHNEKFWYVKWIFFLPKQSQNLDLSYKTDLEFGGSFGGKYLLLNKYNTKINTSIKHCSDMKQIVV